MGRLPKDVRTALMKYKDKEMKMLATLLQIREKRNFILNPVSSKVAVKLDL